jgi:sugar/nucleoside kinase (ribokinase family)
MAADPGPIAVFGNVTLDIICTPVDDVPRHESISFEEGILTPGGCASNTALQLALLGDPVYLIARTGDDLTASFLEDAWQEHGVNSSFVNRAEGLKTGISVGLVDSDLQPRFIHTPGANATLGPEDLKPKVLAEIGVGWLHVAGYFVLPGLLEKEFVEPLARLQEAGIHTSLDVVTSPAMRTPDPFWPLLPHLDIFTCNRYEGQLITGEADPATAASIMRDRGARTVIIKLGEKGCLLSAEDEHLLIPPVLIEDPLDTTGAGDAFAAGLLSGLRRGLDLKDACHLGNQTGAEATTYLGAVRLV